MIGGDELSKIKSHTKNVVLLNMQIGLKEEISKADIFTFVCYTLVQLETHTSKNYIKLDSNRILNSEGDTPNPKWKLCPCSCSLDLS